jgi:hypothetical protein
MSINKSLDVMAEKLIVKVTKDFTSEKKRTRRGAGLSDSQLRKLRSFEPRRTTIKEACEQVMERAYMIASGNGRYPAHARQIMYAARPLVLSICGKFYNPKNKTFSQVDLPNYIAKHATTTANWDVVFDARGAIREPHTNHRVGLGTLEVRRYVRDWHTSVPSLRLGTIGLGVNTIGPGNRFKFVLLIEKEGFDELLEVAQIARRYDIAIASTKGQSTTASRQLVDHLSNKKITTLIAHDCDKYGFEICHALHTSSRRFQYRKRPLVRCLGLRLADARAMALESEPVEYKKRCCEKSLLAAGATEEEAAFMAGSRWEGERIELNAMPSDVFIQWLERKLNEAGVKKVVPDEKVLAAAYKRAALVAHANRALIEVQKRWDTNGISSVPIPPNLRQRIEKAITDSSDPWDAAVLKIADQEGATEA